MSATWIDITSCIRYQRFTVSPLSAEVVLLEGREHLWLFDVGSSPDVLRQLQALPKRPRIILSHFHPDHMANWSKLDWDELYVGNYTYVKTGCGTIVNKPIFIDDGLKMRIFPFPSSHAKGSLALEVDETYVFLGDGIYSKAKQGRPAYNVTLLKDGIDLLKRLKAQWLLLSHADPFLQRKEDVLEMLEGIYAQRKQGCPDIFPK